MGKRSRLTYPSAVILCAIRSGHRYGFEIMDVTGLSDGTVYPAIRRMEKRGLLAATWEDPEVAHARNRPARRYYTLTPSGVEAQAVALARFPGLSRLLIQGDPA